MIIGFDASRAFIEKRSGTENYNYQILTHLARLDHTNQYYIYLRPPADLKSIQSSFPWPKNFKFLLLNFKFFWTQAGLARQTFLDLLDILFVPSHTLPLIRKPGLKTVMTVHDLGAEYLPQAHQLKQRLYLKLMTDFQLKSASHLIAVSQATKSDILHNIHIQPNKISVVYEGYNQKLFKPIRGNTLKNNLKIYHLEPKTYFLFVGTIQPRKNLIRLIKAYVQFLQGAKLTSSKKCGSEPILVLVGSKGWLSDKIYALPEKLGVEKQVKFLGYVPDEKLPALYSGAIAFLFPSLFEGFGLPILEAFSCGCPVLASNTSSLPEVAGKAALLVNPYSIEDITRGIERVQSPESRIRLIKAGKEQLKNFSWEKAAKETLAVFEKTISG